MDKVLIAKFVPSGRSFQFNFAGKPKIFFRVFGRRAALFCPRVIVETRDFQERAGVSDVGTLYLPFESDRHLTHRIPLLHGS
jgi:hypothetical protein